ncbi:MAG: FecR domain-containing protein [Bacteroidota bacterium]
MNDNSMGDFERADQIVDLLIAEKYRPLSEEEQSLLNDWIEEDDANRFLYQSLTDERNSVDRLRLLSAFNQSEAYNSFVKQTKDGGVKLFSRRFLRYAAIIVPLAAALYFTYQYVIKVEQQTQLTEIDVQPGSSKAILVLADGNILNLEEDDINIEDEKIEISNNKKEIVYKSSDKEITAQKVRYNTLKIPRGGEYQLTLSDGTNIWLNSESEIKYPVRFSGRERVVYLKGEAFFEVAKNQDVPFIVNTSGIAVNVLGTSFNVRAYLDENQIMTTLVTGKVMIRIPETQKEFSLIPNEQAVTTSQETIVRNVDVNQYIAWKKGRILFEENTVEEIFNDLSRWYNIEVVYDNQALKELRYSIDIKRYKNLREVLELLELTKKIKFETEENQLLIMDY